MDIEKSALTLIEHAYDATLSSDKWQTMIEKFVTIIDANSAVLREVDYNSGAVGLFNTTGYDLTLKQAYRDHFVHLDIFAKALQQSSAGEVILSNAAVPWSQQLKTEFYNDYMRPQGARYVLGLTLARDAQHHLLFGVQRSEIQGDFTEDHLKLIHLVAPHIARAAQIYRQLHQATAQKQSALSALDCLKVGVILLNDKGQPLFVNRAIEQLMRSKYLIVANDGITLNQNADTLRLQRLISEAALCANKCGMVYGGKLTLDGKPKLQIQVIPLARDDSTPFLNPSLSDACVAVFISTPAQLYNQQLAMQYRLTPAEIKLTLQLLEGFDLETAASQLSLSVQTVRSQLKSIFAKTNVKRQTELILLLLSDLSLESVILQDSTLISPAYPKWGMRPQHPIL